MAFWEGFTKNWADLDADSVDPDLRPIPLPFPPREGVAWAAGVLRGLARWAVVEADPEAGTLHATHATRVWRFVDDVRLRFEPTAEGCRIVGRSRSRVGKGDLGQNARQLKALRRALIERSKSAGPQVR
jgi:uncharacterized protein (DUF1499 family)